MPIVYRRPPPTVIGESFGHPSEEGDQRAMDEDLILHAAMVGLWERVDSLCDKHCREQEKLKEMKIKAGGGIINSMSAEYKATPKSEEELELERKAAERANQAKRYGLTKEEMAKRDKAKPWRKLTAL